MGISKLWNNCLPKLYALKHDANKCKPSDFIGLEEFCKSNILALELYGSQMKDETL